MRKIYNILMIIIATAIIIVSILIIIEYKENKLNHKEIQERVELIKEEKNILGEYKGYEIVGLINIPKINIEYPILSLTNNETLKLSITKFSGNKVNEIGNLSLAGHNNRDGSMFGKVKRLEIGDTINLTDTIGETIEYRIYNKYSTDPNDVSIIETEQYGSREVTLITCNNGNKERLIIKAREANKERDESQDETIY